MTNFKDAKGIHASGAPADPFRYRGRKTPKLQTPKQQAKIQWMLDDFESYHAALLRKLSLGSLPKRAAKYGCADFDLEDQTEYCGDDGTKAKGHNLAGIAAYIVRSAKDPIDYLFSLKKLPAMVIEPIRAYLRVKLAMGRLKAEIDAVNNTAAADINTLERENITVIPGDAQQRPGTSQGQDHVDGWERSVVCPNNIIENKSALAQFLPRSSEVPDQVRDDSGGVVVTSPSSSPQRIPAFKWHTSPSKIYGFKEMRKTYGYDPRDTSVYWIEKRANALRRKWKRHGQKLRGAPLKTRAKATPKPETKSLATECSAEPEIRYFEPADADYNSVWPPVDMPAAPKADMPPKNPITLVIPYDATRRAKSNKLPRQPRLSSAPLPRQLIGREGNVKGFAIERGMISGTYGFSQHVQGLRRAVYQKFGWSYRAATPAPPAMLPMQAWGIISSASGMFKCRGDLSGQAYGGQDFDIVDVYAKMEDNSPSFDRKWPGFRGVIASLAYPQRFSGRTIIRNDLGTLNPRQVEGMKQVGLADLNFERQFEVYADDQVQARALITPDFMERLMEFSQHYFGRGVQCVFLGNYLHIALNTDNKFRFTHDFMAYNYKEAADTLIAEVGAVCLLLEQVQTLQASIGRLGTSGADKARQLFYRDRLQDLIGAVYAMEDSWDHVEVLPERLRNSHYYFCDSLKGLLYPRF